MTTTTIHAEPVTVDDMIDAVCFECSDSQCSHDFGRPDMFGRFNKEIRKQNEDGLSELKRRIIAEALDLDALRLVLDAANCHLETMDERANDPHTLDDGEYRKECDALGDAIAKLETLTR